MGGSIFASLQSAGVLGFSTVTTVGAHNEANKKLHMINIKVGAAAAAGATGAGATGLAGAGYMTSGAVSAGKKIKSKV